MRRYLFLLLVPSLWTLTYVMDPTCEWAAAVWGTLLVPCLFFFARAELRRLS